MLTGFFQLKIRYLINTWAIISARSSLVLYGIFTDLLRSDIWVWRCNGRMPRERRRLGGYRYNQRRCVIKSQIIHFQLSTALYYGWGRDGTACSRAGHVRHMRDRRLLLR